MSSAIHSVECLDCGGAFDCACPDYDTELNACPESVCAKCREQAKPKEPCSHQWSDTYYGHKCEACGLFYPSGSAPWEDGPICGDRSESW